MSAAVCQESKTLEVAEEEEEEKRIEGAEEENKGEREGGREAASKKVGLVTLASTSVASIVANIAFHARDRARINSHKYSMQINCLFREGSTFKVLSVSWIFCPNFR